MIKTFFDLNIISNNLSVEDKTAQEISTLNNTPICFVSFKGESAWRVCQSEKMLYVYDGIIVIDYFESMTEEKEAQTNILHNGQGVVLKINTKYRIRSAQTSRLLAVGQEDKIV